MRRAAVAALLLLAACVTPSGVAVEECNTSWRGIEARIVTDGTVDRRIVPIACMRAIDERRISIGLEMPPDCYDIAAIDLEESADAVAVTVTIGVSSVVGGSCPDEARRVVTEVDLQAPVGDRTLLDGSR